MSGIVDWGLAARSADLVIAGIPGRRPERTPATYSATEVERACEAAIELAAGYAGLGRVADPPVPELLDRRRWAQNALRSLAEAAAPLEARLGADLELGGPLGAVVRRGIGAAIGAETGLAAGYAARRVLGQYDIALFGRPRPPRLLFVADNLAAARASLDAEPGLFLEWVALHETTHVIQFDRVEWLVPHLRGLVTELLEGTAAGIDATALARIARRALRDPRELARALIHGELARLLTEPRTRALLDRVQATMSMVEGHAEHVMDAGAAERGPALDQLRRRLDERRARRGGLGDLIARLLGMDLKLRQYELGKAFCDRVVAAAGPDALRLAWRSPDDLPDLAELEHPKRWLERVAW